MTCTFELCSDVDDSDDGETNHQHWSHTFKPLLTLTVSACVDSFISDSDTKDTSEALAESIVNDSFASGLVAWSARAFRLANRSD